MFDTVKAACETGGHWVKAQPAVKSEQYKDKEVAYTQQHAVNPKDVKDARNANVPAAAAVQGQGKAD